MWEFQMMEGCKIIESEEELLIFWKRLARKVWIDQGRLELME